MSSFGYVQLHEVGSPVPVDSPPDSRSSLSSAAISSKPLYDSFHGDSDRDAWSSDLTSRTSYDDRPSSENARYTALRPTSVRELIENGSDQDGGDQNGRDSSVLVTLTSDNKRRSISKAYITICGLLIACVFLVAFGLIYVFIILPNYKENPQNPDPRVHSSDIIKVWAVVLV